MGNACKLPGGGVCFDPALLLGAGVAVVDTEGVGLLCCKQGERMFVSSALEKARGSMRRIKATSESWARIGSTTAVVSRLCISSRLTFGLKSW